MTRSGAILFVQKLTSFDGLVANSAQLERVQNEKHIQAWYGEILRTAKTKVGKNAKDSKWKALKPASMLGLAGR